MKYLFAIPLLAAATACTTTNQAPPTEPVPPIIAAAPSVEVCEVEEFTVYFDEGETTLSVPAKKVVASAVDSMKRCDVYRMEIAGHADATGSAEVNEQVSLARATAVKNALEGQDIDADRVSIIAYGETRAINEDGKEKPLNRKTTVRLVPFSATPAPAAA